MALVLNPAEFQTKYLAISYKIKVEPIKCYPFFIVHTFLKWKLLQKVYLQTCHRSIKLTFDTKGFPLSLLFFTQLNNWWHVQSTVKRLPSRFSRWSSKTLSQGLNVNGFHIPENEKEVFVILEIVRIQKVVGNISLAHPLYLF